MDLEGSLALLFYLSFVVFVLKRWYFYLVLCTSLFLRGLTSENNYYSQNDKKNYSGNYSIYKIVWVVIDFAQTISNTYNSNRICQCHFKIYYFFLNICVAHTAPYHYFSLVIARLNSSK